MSAQISFKAGETTIHLPYKKWIAFHEPAGEEGISRTFDTEKQAWDYVLRKVNECAHCGKWWHSRKKRLYWSACGCEWNVLETDKFMAADTFEDYLKACGYVSVYKKGEKENQSLSEILDGVSNSSRLTNNFTKIWRKTLQKMTRLISWTRSGK